MTALIQPLNYGVPIVDEQGMPTPYFARLLQKLSLSGDFKVASDGTVSLNTLVVLFVIVSGVAGTNVGPELIAPRAGSLTKCKVVTKASDASTDLVFVIKKNGTSVFSVNPTVAHGTTPGTISTFTTLSVSPIAVSPDDLFTIDIISGSATWQATIVLE
jgi:hypothetical protein